MSQCNVVADLKSVETNGTIISSSTLEELGSHRNGGPRLQFFYLRTPLWAPSAVPSSLPSYTDIYEVLVDRMGECKPLLDASGPQTAQGAFDELLDVAANPGMRMSMFFFALGPNRVIFMRLGVYGRRWSEYNEVATTVDAAFCELIGLPEEDRKQDIKQVIQQASKECVFFTGDARKLPDADRFFSWAQQWIHFVGCVQKDARTVVMFSFDESD